MGPRAELTLSRLLDDYVEIADKRGVAVESTALRTESVAFREILAHGASNGNLSFADLTRVVESGQDVSLDPFWLAQLARVVALQDARRGDVDFALRAFAEANPKLEKNSKTRRFRKLEVELLISRGEDETALEVVSNDEDLLKVYHKYLLAELWNPFRGGPFAAEAKWIRAFNAPLRARRLEPVRVQTGEGYPFDRLTVDIEPGSVSGPKVSVIMTTYKPDPEALFASVKSIINQTWLNLEILVIDDASPAVHEKTLAAVEKMDSRIRVIRKTENGGTYSARNTGLANVTGVYIAGQDDDDWSHPRRIERQVGLLSNNPETPGCVAYAMQTDNNLVRARPGYNTHNPSASTLMFKAEYIAQLGGYLPARKAADTEFQQRLEAVAGREIVKLTDPVTIYRVLPDSLSRSDFRAGWSHPSRRQFKSSYMYWHETTATDAPNVFSYDEAPAIIPERFKINKEDRARVFDVVFAGDWRQYGGPQKSMIEEIRALSAAGFKIGILHLEAARFMASGAKPICAPIQALINQGIVFDVLYDEPAEVSLLVLRYPPILQFPSAHPSRLKVQKLIVVANQAPSERDFSDIRYLVKPCSDNAEHMFGIRALWVPQGPTVRSAIERDVAVNELADYDMPGILDAGEWATSRRNFRSTTPVIGRHSRDNKMKWPEQITDLLGAYPVDGSVDVRIMGGATVPLATLGLKRRPASWLVFDTDELPVRTFLSSVDFYVFFQHTSSYEAFGRAVLEALAAGCVAVLPHHYQPVFGDAAVYCEANEVQGTIHKYSSDQDRFRLQSARAMQRVAEWFSYEQYVGRVRSILSGNVSVIHS